MQEQHWVHNYYEMDCNLSQSYSSEEDESTSSSSSIYDTKFRHLSKQELIQRVIELEQEKLITSNYGIVCHISRARVF